MRMEVFKVCGSSPTCCNMILIFGINTIILFPVGVTSGNRVERGFGLIDRLVIYVAVKSLRLKFAARWLLTAPPLPSSRGGRDSSPSVLIGRDSALSSSHRQRQSYCTAAARKKKKRCCSNEASGRFHVCAAVTRVGSHRNPPENKRLLFAI